MQMRGICCSKEAILVYLMLWQGTGSCAMKVFEYDCTDSIYTVQIAKTHGNVGIKCLGTLATMTDWPSAYPLEEYVRLSKMEQVTEISTQN